jgi:hypothetical protein
MLTNVGFSQEGERNWLRLEYDESGVPFAGKKEIQSDLSSNFYDVNKPACPLTNRPYFTPTDEPVLLGFRNRPTPWLPPTIIDKIDKLRKGIIDRTEMVNLIKKIAEISIDFYNISAEHYVAIRFDGRIVEDANSEIELLLKIQGRDYGIPVFVWHVDHDSFLGWNP